MKEIITNHPRRRHSTNLIAILVPSVLLALNIQAMAESNRVIYGNDDRTDIYEVSDPAWVNLADSTVLLISRSSMQQNGSTWKLKTSEFGKSQGMCRTERFVTQPVTGFCSGFLVSEDRIVTAGHCIETSSDCADTRFVFGFEMIDQSTARTEMPDDDVYSCKRILAQELTSGKTKIDYAVIQLDRPVRNRTPLRVRRTGSPSPGSEMTVIGHPVGLPSKVSGGAKIRSAENNGYFVSNLDTFGGNSGSAVFDQNTHEVEGILVRGEADFVWDSQKGCMVSNRCSDSGCRGEDVTYIKYALPWIP